MYKANMEYVILVYFTQYTQTYFTCQSGNKIVFTALQNDHFAAVCTFPITKYVYSLRRNCLVERDVSEIYSVFYITFTFKIARYSVHITSFKKNNERDIVLCLQGIEQ